MNVHPTLTAFMKTLGETQYLLPEQLRAYQRRQLARILAHARVETDFYADRLAPVFCADGSIDWDRWQEIPILMRSEAQGQSGALAARNLPKQAGAVTTTKSSGSTARPFEYRVTNLQTLASACANERAYRWHGIDPGKLTAMIWSTDRNKGSPDDEETPKAWRPMHPESLGVNLEIRHPVAEQITWLERRNAAYLSTFPTNMREIGRLAREQGKTLSFEALLTHGETVNDATRRELRDCFGLDPVDFYGSTEAGFMAASCPSGPGYHLMADLLSVEIVREDGGLAEAGEEGRIVVTPFYGFAMPLIRYDTGDWGARAEGQCACGCRLPMLRHILGRSRNMFRFSDGSRIWPVLESSDVQEFVPHRQFQVVQTGPDLVEYRYVPIDPALPVDMAGLAAYARKHLNENVRIHAVAVETIGRSAGGKFEDYVSVIG